MSKNPFTAPREVDRYLYSNITTIKAPEADGFPAPLEVDRYLYPISCI